MRQLSIAMLLMVLSVDSISLAAGETEFSSLNDVKRVLIRPSVIRPPSLDKRSGLTESEIKFFKSKFSGRDFHKIEVTARLFWRVPLLSALAAAADESAESGVDPDDEWISRYYDSYRPKIFGDRQSFGYLPIRMVYMSREGFARVEASEELTPSSGRDLLAGIPVADFCERNPGSDVPEDFAVRFSPWDLGVSLVSSTRLEASLLDLVQHPDAFDFEVSTGDEPVDRALPHSEDGFGDEFEHGDVTGWDGVLLRFDSRIKSGTLKINELVAQTRKDQSIDQSTRRLLLATAVSAQNLKSSCEVEGGVWRELTWTKEGWLELFSCLDKDGRQLGAVFRVEDGDFSGGEAIFSLVSEHVRFEAILNSESEGLRVRYVQGQETLNSEYWYAGTGAVRAARNAATGSGVAVAFTSKGEVEWINQVEGLKGYRYISWYPHGSLRSAELLDQRGLVLGAAGFHPNGSPKFWQPIRDGKKDGLMIWWHQNGTLAGQQEFNGNRRFGRGNAYYDNGTEGFSANYADDLPHGRMVWRDPSNRPLVTIGFSGGRPHGDLEIHHGGRILAQAKFDGGTVQGNLTLRSPKSQASVEIPYRSGLISGGVILRDGSGVVRVKSEWLDGQLDGTTESTYVSGKKASDCTFKNGHLVAWASYRPDSIPRYQGEVQSFRDGKATINYYGGADKPRLKCRTFEWLLSDCEAISNGKPKAAPALKDLMAKVLAGGPLKFKPEKCGGAIRSFNVAPLTDLPGGKVELTYRVKELCPTADLATGLQCALDLSGGAWKISTCVYSDDDLVEED